MSDFEGLDINMEEVERSSTIPEGEYPCIIKVCEKTLINAMELQGKKLICKVGIEPERDDSGYGDSNKILRYIKPENTTAPRPAGLPPSMSDESPEESDVEEPTTATPKPPTLS